MSPAEIIALQTVATEAIKILGPATIAAFVAWQAGKSQIIGRLKETDKKNEFEARKAVYDLHVQRQTKIKEGYTETTTAITDIMGALSLGNEKNKDDEINRIIIEMMNKQLLAVQRTSKSLKECFVEDELTDKKQYSLISKTVEKANTIQPAVDIKTVTDNSLSLISIFSDISFVHDCLCGWEIDELLEPYMNRKQKK